MWMAISVRPRHRGAEEQRRVGAALSIPTLSLFEQHRRAGPSFYQEAHRGEPLVPFGVGRTKDGGWLRGDARDTKGTNTMASQRDVVGQVQFIQRILGIVA
jgi:hypothetical protein